MNRNMTPPPLFLYFAIFTKITLPLAYLSRGEFHNSQVGGRVICFANLLRLRRSVIKEVAG